MRSNDQGVVPVSEGPMFENASFEVTRFRENPLITADTFRAAGVDEFDGANINGPSVIRAADWFPSPLGTYYMYFAHHHGSYIRLAYADRVEGPWSLFTGPPVFPLGDGIDVADGNARIVHHVASPDVHIDDDAREVVMYFHGPVQGLGGEPLVRQRTFRATSPDGLAFDLDHEAGLVGGAYLRVFERNGRAHAVNNRGWLWRDREDTDRAPGTLEPGWSQGPNLFQAFFDMEQVMPRHVAVAVDGDSADVFFSCIGHNPERILYTRLLMDGDSWEDWTLERPREVLRPSLEYEGVDLDPVPSIPGQQVGVRQLRDPCLLDDTDGQRYLFYSVMGESGIAGASIAAIGQS